MVAERRVPTVKVGRLVRFDLAEIRRWIEEQRRPSRSQPWRRRHGAWSSGKARTGAKGREVVASRRSAGVDRVRLRRPSWAPWTRSTPPSPCPRVSYLCPDAHRPGQKPRSDG